MGYGGGGERPPEHGEDHGLPFTPMMSHIGPKLKSKMRSEVALLYAVFIICGCPKFLLYGMTQLNKHDAMRKARKKTNNKQKTTNTQQ